MPFAQTQEGLTLFTKPSNVPVKGRWIVSPGSEFACVGWKDYEFIKAHESGAIPTIIHHVVKSLYPKDV